MLNRAASEYEMDAEEAAEEVLAALQAAAADNPDGGAGRVWGNILTGAVIGLVVGGGLALLFAPKRGSELRSDLGGAVDDLKDRAEQVLDDLQGSASDLMVRSRAALDQTRENLIRSVEVGREAYTQKKDELTARLEPTGGGGEAPPVTPAP
jgi:gas vesicle protein